MKQLDEKPTLLIAATPEGSKYAEALASMFESTSITAIVRNNTAYDEFSSNDFKLKWEEVKDLDYAVIILTPNDTGKSQAALNFELGLCLGKLGERRVFVVTPSNLTPEWQSDLMEIIRVGFPSDKKEGNENEMEKYLKAAFERIESVITFFGKKNKIFIQPQLLLDEKGEKLRFKVAFAGPGQLIDVRLRAHLLYVKEDNDGQNSLSWEDLQLTSTHVPEIRYSFSFSHKFIRNIEEDSGSGLNWYKKRSPLSKLFYNRTVLTKEQLKGLTNHKIRLDVNGFDASTMTPLHAKMHFKLPEIKQGKFKRFYKVTNKGEIDPESVDWKLFWEVKEYEKNN